jgi:hypothetical protein
MSRFRIGAGAGAMVLAACPSFSPPDCPLQPTCPNRLKCVQGTLFDLADFEPLLLAASEPELLLHVTIRRSDGLGERSTDVKLLEIGGGRYEPEECRGDHPDGCFVKLYGPDLSCNYWIDHELTFELEGHEDIVVLADGSGKSERIPRVCLWGADRCFKILQGSTDGDH